MKFAPLSGVLTFLAAFSFTVPAQGQPKPHATIAQSALSATALRPGDKANLAVVLQIDEGYHAQSHAPFDEFLVKFQVRLDETPGITFGEPVYPAGVIEQSKKLGKLSVYTGKVILRVPLEVKADAPLGLIKISGSLFYQLCDENACYPPENPKFTVETQVVGKDAEVKPNAPELFEKLNADAPRVKASASLGEYLLKFGTAFLVGLIFNVMPCVLPVLPLKAVGFYNASQHNRLKSIALGGTFSLGLIASFALLALCIVVLQLFNWGELFADDWFRGGLILVLLVMAASTFGLFSFILPTGVYRYDPRHDTYVGNFLFGAFTALLSTPCTFGMFVGLMTFALSQPAAIGVALIMMVGVGMAAPYFVLSAFPELARRFPRTGPWSEIVKQMMGFLLVCTAFFFAKSQAVRLLGEDAFWWALFAVVAAAGAFLIVQSFRYAKGLAGRVTGIVIALCLIVPAFFVVRQLTFHPYQWHEYSDATLADKAKSNITLVDFTADWCSNCKWIEAFVLNTRDTAAYLHKNQVVMIRVDLTSENAAGRTLLNKLNPAGSIPVTAIYSPALKEPVVLNDIYSAQDLKDAISKALGAETTSVVTVK